MFAFHRSVTRDGNFILSSFTRFQSTSTTASKSIILAQEQIKQKKGSKKPQQVDCKPVQKRPIRKVGFESVKQVPSTMNLDPKHILIDKLLQGHQPLLLPHNPNMMKKKENRGVIYIDSSDFLEEEDLNITSDTSSKTYQTPLVISKYIFNKNPETERKLSQLEDAINGKNSPKSKNSFEQRKSKWGRGRIRVDFKKKNNENDQN